MDSLIRKIMLVVTTVMTLVAVSVGVTNFFFTAVSSTASTSLKSSE